MTKCPFTMNSDYGTEDCIKNECMAWHEKHDIEKLRAEEPEGYDALIKLTAMQQGCYERDAELFLEVENKSYCKLIERHP